MDSFSINIKAEKANALKRHRQLQRVASFFRFVEICVVLALVSRFSIQLPVAVKNSSVHFKDLSGILVSPPFVFIIGNIIVITLFAKSGHFSGKNSTNDIYEEFLCKSERVQGINRYEPENREKQSISDLNKPETTEKQSISTQNKPEITEIQSSVQSLQENRENQSNSVQQEVKKQDTCTTLAIKSFERSKSEKLEVCNPNKAYRELRRTVTEKCRKSVECSEGWVKLTYPEDRMSNEEFKSTIESFIERQKRFRRDEENHYCILD